MDLIELAIIIAVFVIVIASVCLVIGIVIGRVSVCSNIFFIYKCNQRFED